MTNTVVARRRLVASEMPLQLASNHVHNAPQRATNHFSRLALMPHSATIVSITQPFRDYQLIAYAYGRCTFGRDVSPTSPPSGAL